MALDHTRIGLRLLEAETAIATNIEDKNAPELVDYETSRIAGQAARLAMLIRGQDVIEDELRLKKIAALELGISAPEYAAVKRWLQEADLIEERTTRTGKQVLNEKVERLNHADNYRRIGELWVSNRNRGPKEKALIFSLNEIVQTPVDVGRLEPLKELVRTDREAVLELGANAAIIDTLETGSGKVYYSPLLWDVNPKNLARFLKTVNGTSFQSLLKKVREKPGTDTSSNSDSVMLQAVSGGILPSYQVTSTAGPRVYSFAPYTGTLLTSDGEKTVLDKARALVSCLRYGSEAATITRIRNPRWILNALTDESRGYKVGSHSELKQQYGMLVGKQLGKVIAEPNGRFSFELIPTKDNLRACQIAKELMLSGEVIGEKEGNSDFDFASGKIKHPMFEVRTAREKRPARADELADLVEKLRTTE